MSFLFLQTKKKIKRKSANALVTGAGDKLQRVWQELD